MLYILNNDRYSITKNTPGALDVTCLEPLVIIVVVGSNVGCGCRALSICKLTNTKLSYRQHDVASSPYIWRLKKCSHFWLELQLGSITVEWQGWQTTTHNCLKEHLGFLLSVFLHFLNLFKYGVMRDFELPQISF